MDENDEFEGQESEDTEQEAPGEQPSLEYLQKREAKLAKENRSLRERLRRSELEAKHGKEIADFVAESGAPITNWESLAEKAAAFTPRATDQEPGEGGAPDEGQAPSSEDEQKLAALASKKGTAASDKGTMTVQEWVAFAQENPSAAFAMSPEQLVD